MITMTLSNLRDGNEKARNWLKDNRQTLPSYYNFINIEY